jgi:hypothetical protein
LFYSIDMIELLLSCGFDALEYTWVKATIGICTLADYSVAKKYQQSLRMAQERAILQASTRGEVDEAAWRVSFLEGKLVAAHQA